MNAPNTQTATLPTATGATGISDRAAAMVRNVKAEIEAARADKWNVLISEEIRPASEMFMPHISVIRLSADADAGDFYFPNDCKPKGRMTYAAMKKLAAEAGIQWVPEQEGIVKKEAEYVAFRAVGRRFTSSGEARMLAGFSDKDMSIKEDELRTGKYEKSEQQIQAEIRKERNFWMRKAESGARGRVIKGFIPIKSAYSIEEMQRPFMVLRYIFSPDMRDNFIKAQFLQTMTQAVSGVYGPQAAPAALMAGSESFEPAHYEEAALVEAPETHIPEAPDLFATPPSNMVADFELLEAEEQTATIQRLIKSTGYDTKKRPEHLKKTSDKYTAADRLELFTILSTLDVGF